MGVSKNGGNIFLIFCRFNLVCSLIGLAEYAAFVLHFCNVNLIISYLICVFI